MPCSAAKLATTVPVPAADLYVGLFHRLCRRAAHAIAGRAGTVLVPLCGPRLRAFDEPLAPYELRMGEPGSVRPDPLRAQAGCLGLHHVAPLADWLEQLTTARLPALASLANAIREDQTAVVQGITTPFNSGVNVAAAPT
ncbi:hypothetical protein ACISU4_01235 [Streptomyces wuyuanensis]|uniref:hypothetical protein n=1 Tax=Streptomyces wuyuanensis TaxID=1196353 RepID=UPI0037FAD0B6